MTPESLDWWADKLAVVTTVLTLAAASAGVFAYLFSSWSSQAKDAALTKYKADAGVAISKANAAAELARADAAKAQEETEKARLELARIDPLNLPIKSLRADVYLLVKPDVGPKSIALVLANQFNSDFFLNREHVAPNDDNPNPQAYLSCGHFLTTLVPGSDREFSMRFDWPSGNFVTSHIALHPEHNFWIDSNVSTRDLDNRRLVAVAVIPGLPSGLRIVSGTCLLTINGSLSRKFLAPQTTGDGQVVFVPSPDIP